MANEIKFFLSGGTANQNPFLSNGGTISNTGILNGLLNNLWPDVSESDSDVGLVDHKVIFIKNVSGGALTGMKAYFGELDQFTGMAILSTTTTNAAVDALANATDPVTDYFKIWDNTGETVAAFIGLNQTNKRTGLYISNCDHPTYNQYPDKLELMMAKTGVPTGTATVKVWAMAPPSIVPTATDNTVIRTIGTIDVATLTTTYTKKTFGSPTDIPTNPTNPPPPPVSTQVDRTNLSFTSAGYTSEYHLYAAGLDWTKSVGLLLYTDGSGEFGLKNLSNTYLMAGTNGMIAIAKKHNMVLLTPFSPNKACADGDGSCWYMGDPPGYAKWAEDLVTKIETDYPIDKRRVAVGGYSSGAQFSTEWWVPSGAAQRTMTNGIIVGISYGGSPKMTEIAYSAAFKAGIHMNWNVGDKDDAYTNDAEFDAKSGFDYYTSHGFQTSLDLLPGKTHVRDGEFGLVMDAQISEHMQSATASADAAAIDPVLPGVGWRIGIEYTTGTATNFVNIGQSTQTAITTALGALSQAWDGSKWVDFVNNLPAMAVYTNHGPCFQSGNPPPPGGGTPPPGDCTTHAAVQGTIPVAGGGGGMVHHGYAITAVTDNGNDGNVAANAVDGNLDTRWSQNSTTAQLTLNMGASHPIDRIKVAWYKGDERQAKFTLSHSTNGSSFTTIPPPSGSNFISTGTSTKLEEFPLINYTGSIGPITTQYIRYTGIGNTVNNWNSVTEIELWGADAGNPSPSPPPTPGGGGINYSKPSSFDTGIVVPNLNNNDFVAIHLERIIPPRSNHVELENYSIIISNEPHPVPPGDEPVPGLPGGPGPGPGVPPGGPSGPGTDPNLPPIGEIPIPTPPGVFDPGTIPPPEPIPDPTQPPPVPIPCPGDPGPGPGEPPPDPGPGEPPPGTGGGGTTPDGIKLATLPGGYTYGEQHTNFNENFKSDGSFRLDCGVQPQLNQLNLTFYLNLTSGSDEISSKLSGGTHSDNAPKNGRCYDIGINQAGDRVRIRKENPHPTYHDGPSHSISLGSLNGKWIGVQSLKWNEGSNCHLQCWIDKSGSTTPTNQWQKILDDIDTGGWFESPYLTTYSSSDSQTTIRVDGMSTSKFHYKFLCATRINKT